MNKKFQLSLSLLLGNLLLGVAGVSAQNNEGISVTDFSIKAGQTQTIKVNKIDIEPKDYTGFQMDITMPSGLTIDDIKANTGYPSSFLFSQADRDNGDKRVMLVSFPSVNDVPSSNINEGIIEITVSASESVKNNEKGTITFSNIMFTGTDVNNGLKNTFENTTATVTFINVTATEVTVSPDTDDDGEDEPYDPDTNPDPEKPNPKDPEYPKHDNNGSDIYELYVDESITFKASTDSGATLTAIDWAPAQSSEDIKVEIDGNNLKLTGLKISDSETTFTASSKYADVKKVIKVKVVPMPVMRVKLSANADNVDINKSITLTSSVYPSSKYTGNVTLSYSISPEDLASINASTGEITGKKAGQVIATLSAQGEAGEPKTASVEITVNAIVAQAVELKGDYRGIIENKKTLKTGEKLTISATVLPANTSYPELQWEVTDNGVLSLADENNNEITVTALKAGVATVTATVIASKDNANPVAATYEITVADPLYGDANDDNGVDVADAMVVAYFIVNEHDNNFCFINADVIPDENIDVADQQEIIDIALGISQNYKDNQYVGTAYTYTSNDRLIASDFKVGHDGKAIIGINLENMNDYKSIQADIIMPNGMNVNRIQPGEALSDHSMLYNVTEDNILKVVIFSMDGKSFNNSETPLFVINADADRFCGKIEIDNVIALSDDADKYELQGEAGNNVNTSSIEGIADSGIMITTSTGCINITGCEGNNVTVYDLAGRMLRRVTADENVLSFEIVPGYYIVKVDEVSQTVIVK